jgi:hypothetical protein
MWFKTSSVSLKEGCECRDCKSMTMRVIIKPEENRRMEKML